MKNLLLILLLLANTLCYSQELTDLDKEYNEKARVWLDKVYSGDRTSLNELGDFLNDKTEFTRVYRNGTSKVSTLRYTALSVLYNSCHFKKLPFNEDITQEEYEQYIDAHANEIFYYPLLDRYTDIDARNLSYPYRLRKNVSKPQKNLEELKAEITALRSDSSYASMIKIFWKIGALETPAAETYLLECADGEHWGMEGCDIAENVLSGIAFSLGHFRTEESLQKLIQLADSHELYAMQDWMKAMARVTNRDLVIEFKGYNGVITRYETLLDTSKSLEAIKQSGYEDFMNQHELSLQNPLRMVEKIDYEWWVFDNLKKDLISQKDPVVLKMVGSRMMKELYLYNDKSKESRYNLFEKYSWATIDFDIPAMLRELTGLTVELEYEGEWLAESRDFEFNIALMNYWRDHYSDYKYHKKSGRFINKKDPLLEPDMLKVYFEQMHSEDGELAMQAYLKVIQESPERIARMSRNFSMDYITGDLNRNLPMFTRKFMRQQSLLIQYCRENEIGAFPKGELLLFLDSLGSGRISFAEQLKRESQLYERIQLDNLIAIENYLITYASRNDQLTEMGGHVLDRWYSEHLDELIDNPKQLRAFLYKSTLYDRLGIIGVVNNYNRKMISLSEEKLAILEPYTRDPDEFVRKNALYIINHNLHHSEDSESQGMSFEEFLQVKEDISGEDAEMVKLDTTEATLAIFFDFLRNETNSDVLLKYMNVVESNLHLNMVPYLIQNYDKEEKLMRGHWGGTDMKGKRHNVDFQAQTNDFLVFYTEKIYDYYNRAPRPSIFKNQFVSSSRNGPMFLWNKHQTQDFWVEKWQKDSTNFSRWGSELFLNQLDQLNQKDSVSLEDLSRAINSTHWNSETHGSVLKQAIQKMPCDDLIGMEEDWDLPGFDLAFMTNHCTLQVKDMDWVVDYFFTEEPTETLNWLKQTVDSSDQKMRAGDELTSVCWSQYFRNQLKKEEYRLHKDWIIDLLRYYSDSTKRSFDKEWADVFYLDLILADSSFEKQLDYLAQRQSAGVKNAVEDIFEHNSLSTIQKHWVKAYPLLRDHYAAYSRFKETHGLFLEDVDRDDSLALQTAILAGDSLEVMYRLIEPYQALKNETDSTWNYKVIFTLLKYGNADGFVGSPSRGWNRYYRCVKSYFSLLWASELDEYVQREFPEYDYYSQEIMLNFMVDQGWIQSQQYTPVSFGLDKITYVK